MSAEQDNNRRNNGDELDSDLLVEGGQGRDRNAKRGRPAVLEHLDPATMPRCLLRGEHVAGDALLAKLIHQALVVVHTFTRNQFVDRLGLRRHEGSIRICTG